MPRPSLVFAAIALTLFVATAAAGAEEAPVEENPAAAPHLLLGAGLVGTKVYCNSCAANDGAPGYAGFFVEPLYRVSPGLALGAVGAFALRPGSKETAAGDTGQVEHESLLRASAELRIGRPGRRADGWFSLELGAAGAYHSMDRYGGVTNPGFQSSWQSAPVFGFGGGADVRLSRVVSLGGSLRFLAYFFSSTPDFAATSALDVYRGAQPSLALSLGVTYDVVP
jgi:hypothetical protein